jgi:hypothetical protein
MKMVGLDWMVQTYNLATRNSDIMGINQGVDEQSGLDAIWLEARGRALKAARYFSDPR